MIPIKKVLLLLNIKINKLNNNNNNNKNNNNNINNKNNNNINKRAVNGKEKGTIGLECQSLVF